MIRQIEELSMSACPALQTHLFDGWVLRELLMGIPKGQIL